MQVASARYETIHLEYRLLFREGGRTVARRFRKHRDADTFYLQLRDRGVPEADVGYEKRVVSFGEWEHLRGGLQ